MNFYSFIITCYNQEGNFCSTWRYGTGVYANTKDQAYDLAKKELFNKYPDKFTVFDLYLTDVMKGA